MGNVFPINGSLNINASTVPVNPQDNPADYFGLFAYMHPMHAALDKALSTFETVLNYVGYVPFVSTFSGAIRIAYGKAEIIGAIAAGALLAVKALFASDSTQRREEFNYALGIAGTYAVHGFANICRGFVESIPFVNFAGLAYDLSGTRIRYPFEAS